MPQEQFGSSNYTPVSNLGISQVNLSSWISTVNNPLSTLISITPFPGDFGLLGQPLYVVAGIDPVIQERLTTRLKTTGQIWPVGFS